MRWRPAGEGKTWDAGAAFLLMAALLTASTRLLITDWTDHLTLASSLALLGAALGLALGSSRFPSGWAAVLALAYGALILPWQLGLTLEQDIAWRERWIEVARRLASSFAQLVGQESVLDPLFFLALVGGLSWLLGVHAGYALARRADPWRAILPPGLAVLVIQVYDPISSRAGYLAAYLFFSLLLVAHTTYLSRRARWQETRTLVPPYAGLDLGRISLVVVAALLLVAWGLPGLARALPPAERIRDELNHFWEPLREPLNRAFAAVRGTGGVAVEAYGPQLALGRGRKLGETLLLTVQAPPSPAPGVRYYWRARTYDSYASGVWSNETALTSPVVPSLTAQGLHGAEGRWTATFTVTTAMPILTLYAPSQPVWVSQPARAVLAPNPDGTVDLIAVQADPYLQAGTSYRVRASLSAPTVAQLRGAGAEYPGWVIRRYLQLPPEITPRTLELARQIAAGQETPYDVAVAVTRYLRLSIRYRETVPPLPSGREPVDWFLFDLREGFCTYYATAEVVLLRAVGIPARLAAGYATGERQGDIYRVRQKDSHAWPEVYFPGIGWVEFEPTVSQPEIQRPLGSVEGRVGEGPPAPQGEEGRRRPLGRFPEMEEMELPEEEFAGTPPAARRPALYGALLLILLVLLPLLATGRVLRRRVVWHPLPVLVEAGLRRVGLPVPAPLRRWAWRAGLPPLLRAYEEVNRALARLGAPPSPADTPAERVARLQQLLPSAAADLQRLLAEYQVALYSPRPGSPWAALQAGRVVRSLSRRVRIRRLWSWGRWGRKSFEPEGQVGSI